MKTSAPSSGKKIDVALVGCGAAAKNLHAVALTELGGEGLVQTVALVDPSLEGMASIGRMFPGARHYRDLQTMLREGKPDLAIIASPHRLHAEQTVACLEKGVHVLCEKPMALTTADCDRMTEEAAKAECLLGIGLFRRFFSSTREIRRIIGEEVLGKIKRFKFLEGESYSWSPQSAFFFEREQAGGGVLVDSGAHTLDLLGWWLGDVADLEYEDDAMGGVEINCRLRLKMTSGAEGTVQLSRDWPLPNRFVIECERGWLAYTPDVMDRFELGLEASGDLLESGSNWATHGQQNVVRLGGRGVVDFMGCFVQQLRNFVAAIGGNERLAVSATEGRWSVALIERCYRERRLLPMAWLEKKEQARAQELAGVA